MNFTLRRFKEGILKRRSFFVAALIFPIAYLLLAMVVPSHYLVYQDVSIAPDAPIAVTSSPVGVQPMSEVVAEQEAFFRDVFALKILDNRSELGVSGIGQEERLRNLGTVVTRDMSLTMQGNQVARISYLGNDEGLGATLAGYYSERLIKRANDGQNRSAGGGPGSVAPDSEAPAASLVGTVGVEPQRVFWEESRLVPLIAVIVLAFLLAGIMAGMFEWLDPSFKSDRQVGRYLDATVLGSVPNLEKMAKQLKSKA